MLFLAAAGLPRCSCGDEDSPGDRPGLTFIDEGSGPANDGDLWPLNIGYTFRHRSNTDTWVVTDREVTERGVVSTLHSTGTGNYFRLLEDDVGIFVVATGESGVQDPPVLILPNTLRLGMIWEVVTDLKNVEDFPELEATLGHIYDNDTPLRFEVTKSRIEFTPFGQRRVWGIDMTGPVRVHTIGPREANPIETYFEVIEGVGLSQLTPLPFTFHWEPLRFMSKGAQGGASLARYLQGDFNALVPLEAQDDSLAPAVPSLALEPLLGGEPLLRDRLLQDVSILVEPGEDPVLRLLTFEATLDLYVIRNPTDPGAPQLTERVTTAVRGSPCYRYESGGALAPVEFDAEVPDVCQHASLFAVHPQNGRQRLGRVVGPYGGREGIGPVAQTISADGRILALAYAQELQGDIIGQNGGLALVDYGSEVAGPNDFTVQWNLAERINSEARSFHPIGAFGGRKTRLLYDLGDSFAHVVLNRPAAKTEQAFNTFVEYFDERGVFGRRISRTGSPMGLRVGSEGQELFSIDRSGTLYRIDVTKDGMSQKAMGRIEVAEGFARAAAVRVQGDEFLILTSQGLYDHWPFGTFQQTDLHGINFRSQKSVPYDLPEIYAWRAQIPEPSTAAPAPAALGVDIIQSGNVHRICWPKNAGEPTLGEWKIAGRAAHAVFASPDQDCLIVAPDHICRAQDQEPICTDDLSCERDEVCEARQCVEHCALHNEIDKFCATEGTRCQPRSGGGTEPVGGLEKAACFPEGYANSCANDPDPLAFCTAMLGTDTFCNFGLGECQAIPSDCHDPRRLDAMFLEGTIPGVGPVLIGQGSQTLQPDSFVENGAPLSDGGFVTRLYKIDSTLTKVGTFHHGGIDGDLGVSTDRYWWLDNESFSDLAGNGAWTVGCGSNFASLDHCNAAKQSLCADPQACTLAALIGWDEHRFFALPTTLQDSIQPGFPLQVPQAVAGGGIVAGQYHLAADGTLTETSTPTGPYRTWNHRTRLSDGTFCGTGLNTVGFREVYCVAPNGAQRRLVVDADPFQAITKYDVIYQTPEIIASAIETGGGDRGRVAVDREQRLAVDPDTLVAAGATSIGEVVSGVRCEAATSSAAFCLNDQIVTFCHQADWRQFDCATQGQVCGYDTESGELVDEIRIGAEIGCHDESIPSQATIERVDLRDLTTSRVPIGGMIDPGDIQNVSFSSVSATGADGELYYLLRTEASSGVTRTVYRVTETGFEEIEINFGPLLAENIVDPVLGMTVSSAFLTLTIPGSSAFLHHPL